MTKKQQSKEVVEDRDFVWYNTEEDTKEVYAELTGVYEIKHSWKETYDEQYD